MGESLSALASGSPTAVVNKITLYFRTIGGTIAVVGVVYCHYFREILLSE
jgi:hypothetical protein